MKFTFQHDLNSVSHGYRSFVRFIGGISFGINISYREKNDTQFVICIDSRMVFKRPANHTEFSVQIVIHAEQVIGFFLNLQMVKHFAIT